MSKQLSIRIPDDLASALDKASERLNLRASDLIRMALRDFLRNFAPASRKPADRVRTLIGSLESGIPDLAERHREYVMESLGRGK
jgi:metal-responsive CopG/Arc/MetJ family transcriptional regulator